MTGINWKRRALIAEEFAFNLAQGWQERQKRQNEMGDDFKVRFNSVAWPYQSEYDLIENFIRDWKPRGE